MQVFFFLGVDDSKVFALSRGVDTEKFKPRNRDPRLRSELGIEETDLVILYVGRLDTVKGVEYLLTAARRLIESDMHIKLLIVGEGRLRTYYEKPLKILRRTSDLLDLKMMYQS